MSGKTILMFCPGSDLYGANRILLEIAKILRRNQFVPIVILSEEGPLTEELKRAEIDVRLIRLGVLRRKYMSPLGVLNRIVVFRKAQRELKRIIEEHQVALIFTQSLGVLNGSILARRIGIPSIWHILEITKKPKWLVPILGNIMKRYGDHFIMASEAVRDHWRGYLHDREVYVAHNGVVAPPSIRVSTTLRKELDIPSDTLLVGMVGRVNFWKGQGYFIQIAHELIKGFDRVNFIMVGDVYPGDEHLYDELLDLIESLGLSDFIHDLRYRSDVPEILDNLDVFVLPSTQPDPFPTTALEAMSHGKAMAATAHGGVVEMIEDGVSGVLIPWDDPQAAAQKILPLLRNEKNRKDLGAAARDRIIHKFSSSHYEERILEAVNFALKAETCRVLK